MTHDDGGSDEHNRASLHSVRERPRTLIVRDGPGMDDLAQSLRRGDVPRGHAIDEVADVFDALAALGAAGTVGAVAIPLRAAGDEPRLVRDAFRRIDPAVRLVLLAPRGAAAIANEAGFDDVVFLPAGSRDIASALRLSGLQASGKTAEEIGVAAVANGPAQSDTSMQSERRSTVPSFQPTEPPQRDMVDLVVDDALQAFAARRSKGPTEPEAPAPRDVVAPPPPRAESDAIGDTDLVDAVISGGGNLVTTALQVIRRELRTDDVQIVSNDDLPRESAANESMVPIKWRDTTLGALVSTRVSVEALLPWGLWLGHWLRLDQGHEELRLHAWTDDLTGAGNRRAFERVLDETIAAARISRRPVSLMYFDIDNFKSYNDRFGHEAGDEVLRETLELLRSVIRRGDHVFRIGGDEFVVIFADSRGGRNGGENAPLESLETIATRFRERVCHLKFPQLGVDAPGTVSVSAGVAMYPWDGHDTRSLLRHADQLALQSKRSGKNMITFGPGARDHCRDV